MRGCRNSANWMARSGRAALHCAPVCCALLRCFCLGPNQSVLRSSTSPSAHPTSRQRDRWFLCFCCHRAAAVPGGRGAAGSVRRAGSQPGAGSGPVSCPAGATRDGSLPRVSRPLCVQVGAASACCCATLCCDVLMCCCVPCPCALCVPCTLYCVLCPVAAAAAVPYCQAVPASQPGRSRLPL